MPRKVRAAAKTSHLPCPTSSSGTQNSGGWYSNVPACSAHANTVPFASGAVLHKKSRSAMTALCRRNASSRITRIFSGLMSRCRNPYWCILASPSKTSASRNVKFALPACKPSMGSYRWMPSRMLKKSKSASSITSQMQDGRALRKLCSRWTMRGLSSIGWLIFSSAEYILRRNARGVSLLDLHISFTPTDRCSSSPTLWKMPR
mmetsp:Transcript_86502/g.242145  ORF Transcript_86502/g.242145 Transcript_86502/m.242145 type:complete len:204 (-) Transcript_86502:266-877(-)